MPPQNTDIRDTVQIGSVGKGDIPLQQIAVSADLRTEYVSGSPSVMLQSYLRSLPFYIDDISAAFGDDIYERMSYDPTISSSALVLILGALGQGMQLTPAAKIGDPEFELATELADFCQANLNGCSSQPHRWMVELAEGVKFGNKIAEKVYRDAEKDELEPFPELTKRTLGTGLMLGAMKVKPRHSYAFVVDIYQNLVGLLGLQPGKGISVLAQTLLTAQMVTENLLPREKFVVFSHLPENEDPRGRSALRPGYNAWFAKQQAYGEYLKYLAQWGTPGVEGETPEKATAQPVRNPDGSYQLDQNGRPITIDPEQKLVNILENYRGGACVAVPHGTNIKPFEAKGDGTVFLKAFEYSDSEMAKAILGQTLATGEGKHDSRAAASVHQDILGLFVEQLKRELESCVQNDVIRELIRLNYGPDLLRLAPKATLGDVSPQDIAALMTAVAALQTSGYIDDSQKPALDARMGMPVRVVSEEPDGTPDADDAGQDDEPAQPPAGTGGGTRKQAGKKTPAKMSRLSDEEASEFLGYGRLSKELQEMRRAA